MTFPAWKPPSDLELFIDVWHEYLASYPYKLVVAAVVKYATTDVTGFAPSPGQIIEQIRQISVGDALSEQDAWNLVSKAIRNGTYGAKQEFEKLPEIVQKTVGSPQQLRYWSQSDMESIETVIRSNFMKNYRVVCKREQEIEKIPTSILRIMERNKNERLEGKTDGCLPQKSLSGEISSV